MIREIVTYTNYNGEEVTEELCFNLTQKEVMGMEVKVEGGMSAMLNKIVEEKDVSKILNVFTDILLMSYGERSEDGRRFKKSKDLSEEFLQTEAFNAIFMKMFDADYAAKFIEGILPAMPKDHLPGKTNQPISITE